MQRWKIEFAANDVTFVTFDAQRWNREANLLYFYREGEFRLAVNTNRVKEMRPA
jgi:hypothetical protein